MQHIALPTDEIRPLPFYLAMEEYVARRMNLDDAFFLWQVRPTVIFGRNQLIESEVNLDYCRRHNIETYRRKSGGGCVYADMSNVMFSYVTRSEQVAFTFNRYINMVLLVLYKMGIEATSSGRNDILIGGRKVSGNAFYHVAGHSIVHGTMLYDTCMEHMVGAITPDDDKLRSKGVSSVRQRIALLKDHTTLTLEQFKQHTIANLCDGEITLSTEAVGEIETIMQEYLTPEFIYGRNPRYTVTRRRRFEGVGEFEARLELHNNVIMKVDILGDYFLLGDLDATLLKPLRGCPLTAEALARVLPEDMGAVIHHMTTAQMSALLLGVREQEALSDATRSIE